MPAVKKWFKAKNYGWGWTPQTFEGYLTLLIFVVLYIALTIIFIMRINDPLFAPLVSIIIYLILLSILTVTLIGICWATGEKPEWRWGNKKMTS